ncbi:hypothetical protein NDU88_003679 [Pleurodeles waltl]|uniref:Uncharacterized protein n=1 Tax=Pleurodeles waltl TaxID=8319 RepID=A0AAV7W2V2_PLEWA|nr:hypothetical protein NDU88_003679 [Pleurodeles waltl]
MHSKEPDVLQPCCCPIKGKCRGKCSSRRDSAKLCTVRILAALYNKKIECRDPCTVEVCQQQKRPLDCLGEDGELVSW